MTVKLGTMIQVEMCKTWPNEAAHFIPEGPEEA